MTIDEEDLEDQARYSLSRLANELQSLVARCILNRSSVRPQEEIINMIKSVKSIWRIFALERGIVKRYNLSNFKPETAAQYTLKNRLRYRAYYRKNRDKILNKQRATIARKKALLLEQQTQQAQQEQKNHVEPILPEHA